jgi:hypothetical protein
MIRLTSYQIDWLFDGDNSARDQDVVNRMQKTSAVELKALRQLYTVEELEQANEFGEVIIIRYG